MADRFIVKGKSTQAGGGRKRSPSQEPRFDDEEDFGSPRVSTKKRREQEDEEEGGNSEGEGEVQKGEGLSSSSSSSSSSGLVKRKIIRWSWQKDMFNWEEYPEELSRRLEEALSKGKKVIAVDDERFIDLTKMVQRRQDDHGKQRMVKREETLVTVAAAAADGGLSKGGGTSKSSTPSSPLKVMTNPSGRGTGSAFTTRRANNDDSSSSSSSSGGGGSGRGGSGNGSGGSRQTAVVVGRWSWLSEKGWQFYDEVINERLEECFKAKKKTLRIDEQRFVDLDAKKQCRYDDPSKQRSVKREEIEASPRKNTQQQQQQRQGGGQVKTSPKSSHLRARWYWQTDDHNWLPYELELSNKVEAAFLRKAKEVAVDKERFIDLSNQIQRRYDNENRRRFVKRQLEEAPPSSSHSPQKQLFPGKNSGSSSSSGGNRRTQEDEKEEEEEGHRDEEEFEEYDYRDDADYLPNRADRRKVYRCGDRYLTLEDIPTWFEQASEIRERQPLKVSKAPSYTVSDVINKKISLFHGDITSLEIDAIVNAARPSLLGGGGVDGAIHKAAGKGLLRACMQTGGCEVGDAVLTNGFRLPANNVIHTVGPLGESKPELMNCYVNSMALLEKHKLSSIAFCCISTGVYGYPPIKAANVALSTIREWLQKDGNHKKLQRVIFCTFLEEDKVVYEKLIQFYFPVDPSTLPPPSRKKGPSKSERSQSASQDRSGGDSGGSKKSGNQQAQSKRMDVSDEERHEMVHYGEPT